ncbi:hypothetical protein, partial [Brevibacterium casei]
VRHDETSLPARSSEHQDDSHNDWTYIPGSAHVPVNDRGRSVREVHRHVPEHCLKLTSGPGVLELNQRLTKGCRPPLAWGKHKVEEVNTDVVPDHEQLIDSE